MGPSELSAGLTALIIFAGLILLMRWVFAPSRRGHAVHMPVNASDARELGLLMVVTTALPRAEAARQHARLAEAGVRASLSRRSDGGFDLLVFAHDVERARAALAG